MKILWCLGKWIDAEHVYSVGHYRLYILLHHFDIDTGKVKIYGFSKHEKLTCKFAGMYLSDNSLIVIWCDSSSIVTWNICENLKLGSEIKSVWLCLGV